MNILAATKENPLIPPWGEIIIGLIAFGLVVLVMMRLVAPRFEQVFRARREAIGGGSGGGGADAGRGRGGAGAVPPPAGRGAHRGGPDPRRRPGGRAADPRGA